MCCLLVLLQVIGCFHVRMPLIFRRLCELVIDATFNPASHVSQSTLIKHGVTANSAAFTSFRLLHTKTKEDGDDMSMTDMHCDCSPSFAFNHHLHLILLFLGMPHSSTLKWRWVAGCL